MNIPLPYHTGLSGKTSRKEKECKPHLCNHLRVAETMPRKRSGNIQPQKDYCSLKTKMLSKSEGKVRKTARWNQTKTYWGVWRSYVYISWAMTKPLGKVKIKIKVRLTWQPERGFLFLLLTCILWCPAYPSMIQNSWREEVLMLSPFIPAA